MNVSAEEAKEVTSLQHCVTSPGLDLVFFKLDEANDIFALERIATLKAPVLPERPHVL